MKIKTYYGKKKIPLKGIVLTGKRIRALEEDDLKIKDFKKRYNIK